MAKQYLLFAKKEIDTNKQAVSVNQVVQMWGYIIKISPIANGIFVVPLDIESMVVENDGTK